MTAIAHPKPVPRPSQFTAPTDHYPIGVILAGNERVTVGVELGPDDRHANVLWEGSDPAERDAAVVDAIVNLAATGERVGQTIHIHLGGSPFAHAARALADVSGRPFRVIDCTAQALRLQNDIVEAIYLEPRPETCPTPVVQPPLVVGTDASRGRGADRRMVVGWAYVSTEGTWGMGRCRRGTNVATAELVGVVEAARKFRGRDLVIFTDCRAAISTIRFGTDSKLGTQLQLLSRGRTITVSWIPGHAGLPLNETAHRLAMNAFRHIGLATDDDTATQVGNNIVDDMLCHLTDPVDIDLVHSVTLRDGDVVTCDIGGSRAG